MMRPCHRRKVGKRDGGECQTSEHAILRAMGSLRMDPASISLERSNRPISSQCMPVRRQSQKAGGHQPVSLALIEQHLKEGFLPLAVSLAPRLSVSGAITAIVIGLGWGLGLMGGGRRSHLGASPPALVDAH